MRTTITFEISEAANHCGIEAEEILQFISFEWIQPMEIEKLLLDEDDLSRIRLISELKNKLGVNNEAVPIILHLVDQLNHLHLGLRNDARIFKV